MIMADKMDDKTGSMTSCVTWSMIMCGDPGWPLCKLTQHYRDCLYC